MSGGEVRRVHPGAARGQGDRLARNGENDRRKPDLRFKVERDEFPPPAEDKVRLIAGVIGCDVDELLARAGKVATDLSDIIKRNPVEVAALLRTTKGLTADELTRLAREAQKSKDK